MDKKNSLKVHATLMYIFQSIKFGTYSVPNPIEI